MKFMGCDAYKIREVRLITEYKDGCIFKTKAIGYMFREDTVGLSNVCISFVSTKLSEQREFVVNISTIDEMQNIIKETLI